MGHSFVLKAMEQLISPDFIPTWDSLVFKVHALKHWSQSLFQP